MDSKTITWVVIALVAFVLFKDKLLGPGGLGLSGAGGGYPPTWPGYSPGAPAPNYATTPPPTPTNQWDTANNLINQAAQYLPKLFGGGGGA